MSLPFQYSVEYLDTLDQKILYNLDQTTSSTTSTVETPIISSTPVQNVRAVLVAHDLVGEYKDLHSDTNGNLNTTIVSNEWTTLAIAEVLSTYGDIVTIKPKTLFKYGYNSDVDVNIPETVWITGGNETFLTTNTISSVVSTSSADTQLITIEGHTDGGSYTFLTQQVTLTGQTPVTLPTPLVRVSRLTNDGTTDFTGLLTVYDTTGTSTAGAVTPQSAKHLQIEIGTNQSQKCQTTFSNSDYGFLTQVTGSISSKATAVVEYDLQIREYGKVFKTRFKWTSEGSSTVVLFAPYIIVPKNSDIRIVAISNTNNIGVFASFNSLFGLVQ